MRAVALATLVLTTLAAPSSALAQNEPSAAAAHAAPLDRTSPEDPAQRAVFPDRRNGVVFGVSPGIAMAGSSGTPNNAKLLNDPAFMSQSPLMVGWSSSFFLMGALADWVSFGPMVNVATFETAKWKSTGLGVGFRLEVFPLLHRYPRLADTALYTQLGVGSTELRATGNYPDADGTSSFLGIGIHHEFRLGRFLGGHGAAGPYFEYDAITSQSAERHWASLGIRVVWYGGTVSADQ